MKSGFVLEKYVSYAVILSLEAENFEQIVSEEEEENSDVVLVNVWNQEDGQLRLSHQKPVLKETFSEMEEANNFSLISSLNPGAGRVPQF